MIEQGIQPDGKKVTYKVFKFPLAFGSDKKYLGGVALDITQELTQKEQVQKSNERFKLINKATSEAIWDWDMINNTVIRGEGFIRHGYPEDIHPYGFALNLIHPKDHSRIEKSLQQAITSNKDTWQDEYRFKCKDGSYKIILDRACIVRDNNGKAIRMLGTMQDLTEKKKLQQQVAALEEQKQKEILDAVMNAQEKERHEIAYELHENVSQVLTSCKLFLDIAVQNNNWRFVEKSTEEISKVVNEIRSMSYKLNASSLKMFGLVRSLQDIVYKINNDEKTQVALITKNITEEDVLDATIELSLYRIVQEQLNNVLKHASANKVEIVLEKKPNAIVLEISDNGKGFKLDDATTGLGLKNIFNRTEYHKGKCTVKTAPGKGCKLHVQLPLHTTDFSL